MFFFFPITLPLLIFAAVYVVGCFLVELEYFGWTTLLMLVATGLMLGFNVFDALTFVKGNIGLTLLYFGGYFAVGVVWSFVKWFSYLMRYRSKFRDIKSDFLNKHTNTGGTNVPENQMAAFDAYCRQQWVKPEYSNLKHGLKPVAVQNKAKITAWVAYWPCSVISTFLNDPVRRILRFLWNLFKGLYQRMSDAVFADDPELK